MAKAAQNAGSIRQRKNGKWEARVTIGTDPGTGKPIRRSIYDIKSVQDLLGHATASFTLNVYAHTSEQMMKDTAARVQGYYDNMALGG